MNDFDLTVIGAGPGGYVAAIRASQLGMKVAVIEERKSLGGTCLNIGCIPSKALLNSSEKYESINSAQLEDFGINLSSVKLNITKMMENKDNIVSDLTKGIEFLFKKNKVSYFKGKGSFKSSNEIIVSGDGKETLKAEFNSESLTVSFNARYLLDIASEIGDQNLMMNLNDAISPVLIQDKSDNHSFYVIMPMKI